MHNLEEVSKLLETCNLPRINHEEMESQNRLIISMEIKSVVKNFPTKKSLRPDGFTGKFYQTLREESLPIFLQLVQKHWKKKNTLRLTFIKLEWLWCKNQTMTLQEKYEILLWLMWMQKSSTNSKLNLTTH